ncbi:MAG: acyl-CoA dehydrogenase family protein, partial [Bdellovibrionota bacterium]
MFEFSLSEEEEMVRKTAADFAAEKLFPPFREHEAAGSVPGSLRSAYGELGLAGLDIPEAQGGSGLSSLVKSLVLESLAGGDAAAALALDGAGPALYPLLEMGGETGAGLVREFLSKKDARGWVVVDREG